MDDTDQAVELASKALAASAGEPWAHLLLVHAIHDAGRVEDARIHLESARLSHPEDLPLLELDLELALEVGDLQKGLDLSRLLCKLPESRSPHHAVLIQLLGALGDVDGAVEAAEEALQAFGSRVAFAEALALAFLHNDHIEDAVDVLAQAVDMPDATPGTSLLLADALGKSGELDEAIAVASSLSDSNPLEAQPAAILADLLADAGRWDAAREAAERALSVDPGTARALLALGKVQLIGEGDTVAAQRSFRAYLEQDPGHRDARFLLAQAIQGSDPGNAAALLDELVEEAPDQPAFLLVRGKVHMDQDRFEEARADLERAAGLSPDDPGAWTELGEATRLLGDLGNALRDTERALELDPEYVMALLVRSLTYRDLGDIDASRAELQRVLEVAPEHAYAHLLLAQLPGRVDERAKLLDRVQELGYPPRLVAFERAGLSLEAGDFGEALAAYDALLASGREIEALTGRFEALRLLERLDEAIAFAEEAAADHPDDPQILRNLGVALVSAERYDEGVDRLRRVVDLRPGPDSWGDLGWALEQADQIEEALVTLDHAHGDAPDSSWLLTQLCRSLGLAGAFEESAHVAGRATGLDADSDEAWGALGWALQYQDAPDHAGAERSFDRAWSIRTEADADPWYLKGRANARQALGMPSAQRDYEHALALAREASPPRPWLTSTAAWCLYRLGDLTGAARTFQEARTLTGKPGSDDFDLALVTLCSGRETRALSYYSGAVTAIRTLHPLTQRGLLKVAVIDLKEARATSTEGAAGTAAEEVLSKLTAALDELPALPPLEHIWDAPARPPVSLSKPRATPTSL